MPEVKCQEGAKYDKELDLVGMQFRSDLHKYPGMQERSRDSTGYEARSLD